MSKVQLKKELTALSREQLIEVILTAYSSSKAVKTYFDFFADPDVDKLYDRHVREMTKEIERGKWRNSTARISRIRKTIKDFESLNPGAEHVCDLRIKAIELLINQYSVKQFSDTLIRGTLKLIEDTIAFADRNLMIDTTLAQISALLDDSHDRARNFRRYLRNNLQKQK